MAERFLDLALTAGRVATGLLGWPPDHFWAATPAELALAIEGRIGVGVEACAPLDAGSLQRLMREMPDGR